MLMIRLQRVGRKHEPVFRLVLTDSKNGPKSGKFLEILGSFDMRIGDSSNFKIDRIKEFMSKGAQISDTVHNLLIDKKVIDGKKINKLPKKSAPKKEEVAAAPIETKTEEAKAEEVKEESAPEAPAEQEAPTEEVAAEVAPEATS